MQMHYATEVNNLDVYLPWQYGYLNDRNVTVNRLHLGKNCLSSRVWLNLTVTRLKVTRPSFSGEYHPTLKLSGIPTFTFIVSITHKMDNI